ncbi:hypothetical protein [Bacillus phage YungSlug]|nr:hypothetical protein [Bacillus phage YungSlug]
METYKDLAKKLAKLYGGDPEDYYVEAKHIYRQKQRAKKGKEIEEPKETKSRIKVRTVEEDEEKPKSRIRVREIREEEEKPRRKSQRTNGRNRTIRETRKTKKKESFLKELLKEVGKKSAKKTVRKTSETVRTLKDGTNFLKAPKDKPSDVLGGLSKLVTKQPDKIKVPDGLAKYLKDTFRFK